MPHIRQRFTFLVLYLGVRSAFIIIAFLAMRTPRLTPRSNSFSKGHSEFGKKGFGLRIRPGGSNDDYVKSRNPFNLVKINFRKNNLLGNAHGIVSVSIKSVLVDPPEVFDTGKCDIYQSVKKLIHHRTPQGYLCADFLSGPDFEVRASAPSVTSISHTLPQAGDEITITGTGLQGVESITFPGNVVVSKGQGIVSDDEEGKWCTVVVPEGVSSDGGSILVTGANGGAYSPACFNYRKGLIHNFDDVQNYSWGSNIDNTALTDVLPSDRKPQSQGGYQVFNSTGSLAAGSYQRFWLNSNVLMTVMSAIPASTAVADCGIQMDIYVDGEWNSGIIRFVMADGWGSSRYCMLYQPVYINKVYDKTAFVNPGCWFTVTLPFSLSADFEGKTLGDVITQMSSASYKQSGPWFENSGITDVFDPLPATGKVYFDNIRVVPLNTPTYSDFPDE